MLPDRTDRYFYGTFLVGVHSCRVGKNSLNCRGVVLISWFVFDQTIIFKLQEILNLNFSL